MGIISDLFSTILMITKKNIKAVIIILLILGMLFPLIDSLLIKPIQIDQEISVLNKIHELEKVEFSTEIEKQLKRDIDQKVERYLDHNHVSISLKQRYFEDPWKLYSGIMIWVILLFVLVFRKELKWYMRIASVFLVILFISGIGAVGLLLPTLGSPWVNYFMYPIIQIVFLVSAMDIKTKKRVT
ncbi:hypothetical protein [uncultured Sphaerochaeta sp.]|uniref:hypothetical protein n=1 Tax=uncultured Sphaerochaeta sp. TaxID=886478 RepID=UPI003748CA09